MEQREKLGKPMKRTEEKKETKKNEKHKIEGKTKLTHIIA